MLPKVQAQSQAPATAQPDVRPVGAPAQPARALAQHVDARPASVAVLALVVWVSTQALGIIKP